MRRSSRTAETACRFSGTRSGGRPRSAARQVYLRAMGSPWFEDERDDKPEDDQEEEEDTLSAPGTFLVPAERSSSEDNSSRVREEKVKSACVGIRKLRTGEGTRESPSV